MRTINDFVERVARKHGIRIAGSNRTKRLRKKRRTHIEDLRDLWFKGHWTFTTWKVANLIMEGQGELSV